MTNPTNLRDLPQPDLIKVIESLISDTEWGPETEDELRELQNTVTIALSNMLERVNREELEK